MDPTELAARLDELREQHGGLDAEIGTLLETGATDQLLVARLKKRKLRLKDEITAIERLLIPDIIA